MTFKKGYTPSSKGKTLAEIMGPERAEAELKRKSEARKGKKASLKTRAKMSATRKGKTSWKKGKTYEEIYGHEEALIQRDKQRKAKTGYLPKIKGKKLEEFYGVGRAQEMKQKMSVKKKGKTLIERYGPERAEEIKKKQRETRKRTSIINKGKYSGPNSVHWKGGLDRDADAIRRSFKCVKWKQAVLLRDNFTCQQCGQIGGKLQAHHIKPFGVLIEEVKENLSLLNLYEGAMIYTPLWDVNNGTTLCVKCHVGHKKVRPRKKLKQ